MKNKAIFLDRDGVLNHAIIKNGKPYPPATLAELTIPQDAQSALDTLKLANYLLIGATNQPDVARGKTSAEIVASINAKLISLLKLTEIRVCFHDDQDSCHCRKPLPGLLITAAQDYDIDLSKSYMIGDRWKDIEAGKNAGCQTILLQNNYLEPVPPRTPDFIATNLTEATQWILSKEHK